MQKRVERASYGHKPSKAWGYQSLAESKEGPSLEAGDSTGLASVTSWLLDGFCVWNLMRILLLCFKPPKCVGICYGMAKEN